MSAFNVQTFRSYFPILHKNLNECQLIYFDNAATTQKPQCVLDKYQEYYSQYNANVHRASHQLSSTATTAYEKSREGVKNFINASFKDEIIWTKGTTEGVNLLSYSLGQLVINEGDEIILSQSEHHANIVPWQLLAEQKKAHIKILPLTKSGTINVDTLENLISEKTKIVSVAHISNVIGKLNPIEKIVKICKKHNIISIIDGAQAIAHQIVDVQVLDCDFYLFSAHKMYGPTGVGVLYGKRELLNKMPPYHGGGEMIKKVSFSKTTFNHLPFKFEAGTPNISGIIAFLSAIQFIESTNMVELIKYEEALTVYCYQQLLKLNMINFIVDDIPTIPIFSFTIEGHHNQDIASFLDVKGIAIRAGHHCAMPLMEYLSISGCVRLSLTAYNTFEEVDYLIRIIKEAINADCDKEFLPVAESTSQIDNSVILSDNLVLNEKLSASDKIIALFSVLKGWDTRHREIMLMGKKRVRMPEKLRNDKNIITGCESNAWLTYQLINNAYVFDADSDSKLVRGLITIVLAAFNNKTQYQIQIFNINSYFEKLGLQQHLSPSRTNGLNAIVDKIYKITKV